MARIVYRYVLETFRAIYGYDAVAQAKDGLLRSAVSG
jgi:hypothetical protein